MSEPKLISPLLDGFSMGNPISSHDGVYSCPAMKENSDDKYIVKVISVPASQVQLEALLLTGAYKDPADATDYFKDLANDIVKEAQFLRKVSKLEGFLPFENWQIVPKEDNELGYDVYLVGSYKHSLERFMGKNLMTHLGAVNLGLDMCAALAISRQAGCIYVDLKPSNIFISEDKEYRIGDLGFVDLSSLKYTSLPSKYRSQYTAPELNDAMSTLNTTVDTYAVGLILYQIYNNGQLPFEGNATAEVFPSPENADYEIAEIILKACAPDPKDRWKNPIEMGQALVAYMQRNEVNDIPITPPSAAVSPSMETISIEDTRDDFASLASAAIEEDASLTNEDNSQASELAFMEDMVSDETAPGEEDASDAEIQEMSEELSSIFAQADDLIAHEAPDGVVVPDPIDVPIPEPIPAAEEVESSETENDAPEFSMPEDEPHYIPDFSADFSHDSDNTEEDELDDDLNDEPKKRKGWIAIVIIVLLLGLLGAGALHFYRDYYLMQIDGLDVKPHENQVTVLVDTDVDTSLLTVVCTDSYGNKQESKLTYGQAIFTDLLPDTQYKVHLETEGFHQLVGSTSNSFSTDAVTNIVSFAAVTGTEDGSVILNFTVDGPDSDEWMINYTAEEEAEQTAFFTGHMVTITGLAIGKTYTFSLAPVNELYIVGQTTLEFTASKLIMAENLTVTDCSSGVLTAQWTIPEDASVESWTALCYSDDGYSETIEVNEPTATFHNIDSTKAYTLEILAAGMTQPARTNVTANPITISSVSVNDEETGKLTVNWEYQGTEPEGGWLLMYTMDGNETQEVVSCEGTSGTIEPRIPGVFYDFTIQAASGASVFGGSYSFQCPNAKIFDDKNLAIFENNINRNLTVNMLATPEKENWSYKDVKNNDYTNSFASGQKASLLLYLTIDFYIPHRDISVLYVIRDAEGKVITPLIGKETRDWYDMWWNTNYHYCELDIPSMPTEIGNYTLSLYFDNMAITTVDFTVTE